MTVKITRRKDILTSQEKDVTIKINTTLWLEYLTNHENGHIGLHNYDRTITRKWTINIHVKKDKCNKIKL